MYKDTKLCNVLFTYELARRLKAAGVSSEDVTANVFNPGLITDSGLFRSLDPLFVKNFKLAGKIGRVSESVEVGSRLLTNMVLNPTYFRDSGKYWSNELVGFGSSRPEASPGDGQVGHDFMIRQTSPESQDAAKAARLYDVSARLVGLDSDAAFKAAAASLRS
eukprot:gnl/TRDRNA2_/TRDRNA2_116286_c0_seq1.p1 gnl/TRDRNA2_/TRDRNA2_116286_c0~~gnl/TRDRNA2_/TRDRNA2_116286_c0_seq1.p1  ORF type:complete len:163 (-),score=29.30 gnl/TRDRNA2_/TRDRNA2_116286_c0_seq1:172-660(-)